MLKLIVIKYLTKVIWPQNYIFSTTFIKMQFYCDLKTLIESYKNNDLNLVIFEWNWIQHKNRFYFLSKSASSFMIFWGYRGRNKKYYMAWNGGSTHSTHFYTLIHKPLPNYNFIYKYFKQPKVMQNFILVWPAKKLKIQ